LERGTEGELEIELCRILKGIIKGVFMKFVFNKKNKILLILAIIMLIIGYIIMGTGDKTISPILLIIAYVVLIPAAIMTGVSKTNE